MSDSLRPTGDGFPTLYSPRYRQTFHSHYGARREAEHVFLEASGVADRLHRGVPTRVLEVGFGAGLNFWLTAAQALHHETPLVYTALEHALPSAAVLRDVRYGARLGMDELEAVFLDWRSSLADTTGAHTLNLTPSLSLHLILGDARTLPLPPDAFDTLYLDVFSPDTNPELWTVDFLRHLHDVLRPGGVLTTYSAKGAVRRALVEAGFAVEKRPGPPGKREMLRAAKPTAGDRTSTSA